MSSQNGGMDSSSASRSARGTEAGMCLVTHPRAVSWRATWSSLMPSTARYPSIESASVGQPSTARRMRSSGSPAGSTTMTFISSSRSNVLGAWNAQLPDPMHRSRSVWICSAISATLPDAHVRFRGDGLGTVIDSDAHVNEDPLAWTELSEAHPGWLGAGRSGGQWVAEIRSKLYPTQEGPGCGVPIHTATSPACAAGAADLDQRLADMDAEGIDVQVLFGGLIIGLTSYDDAGFGLDVARTYNDWLLSKVCGHAPERLLGVGVAPLQDLDRALGELERAKRLGAVGVAIPPVLGASNLDDAAL